jgi:hypothetical protein
MPRHTGGVDVHGPTAATPTAAGGGVATLGQNVAVVVEGGGDVEEEKAPASPTIAAPTTTAWVHGVNEGAVGGSCNDKGVGNLQCYLHMAHKR